MLRTLTNIALACLVAFNLVLPVLASDRFITVQSTTSTQNSGLFDHILPMFTEETGIEVRVVAVGTGQALKNASNGDGDVLLVHAKSAEEAFVEAGDGIERFDVMYNDFVIVGPSDDPANIEGSDNAIEALQKIALNEATFVSRGDDSGTHKAEMRLWDEAGLNVVRVSGSWYRETGSGMGTTLNIGIEMDAYILTDRSTWISFGNKRDHKIVVEGDERLFNQYGIIQVNPDRHPNVKKGLAQQFVDWIISAEGQSAIESFRMGGKQLFYPNARPAS